MSLKFCLTLLFCIAFSGIVAQPAIKKRADYIQFSSTYQYYFNRSYIENDGKQPNPITAQNTTGYNIGLAYQHITRHGFTINYGICIGKQVHKINLDYDLRNFDPGAKEAFRNAFHHSEYSYDPIYLSQRVMLGYIKDLSSLGFRTWSAETKVGIAFKSFNRRMNPSFLRMRLEYEMDNQVYTKLNQLYVMESRMGNEKWDLRPGKNAISRTFEGYIGLRKELHGSILKNFNVGIEYTQRVFSDLNDIWVNTYDHQGNIISTDYYYNKQQSLGLCIGLGIWFK